MTESGWLQLATLITAFFTGCFTLYLNAKYNKTQTKIDQHSEKMDIDIIRHQQIDAHVGNQVQEVKSINLSQNEKMDSIHRDINGRVTELIAAKVDEKVKEAVAAALAAKERK